MLTHHPGLNFFYTHLLSYLQGTEVQLTLSIPEMFNMEKA